MTMKMKTREEIREAINKKVDKIDGSALLNARTKAKKLRKLQSEIDKEIGQ